MKYLWLGALIDFRDADDVKILYICIKQYLLKFFDKDKYRAFFFILLILFYLSSCSHRHITEPPPRQPIFELPATQRPYKVNGHIYYPLPSAEGFVEVGYASWYGNKFHGRPTASGELYDMYAMTAAHRILPMNTYVRVLNLENRREVVVRISDRGPFVKNRIIDLSYVAANKIGLVRPGTARVKIEVLGEVELTSRGIIEFKSYPDFKRGKFYVQVGAFLEPNNAYILRRKMARHFKEVVINGQLRGAQTFYRVQVFAANEYNVAKKLEARLENSGFPGAFVVAK